MSTRQQSLLRDALGLSCATGAASNEIVVCGKREPNPYRLPLPPAPEPGAREAGDVVDPLKIMKMNPQRCPPARPRPPPANLDLLAIAAAAVAVAVKVADPEFQPVKPPEPKNCG